MLLVINYFGGRNTHTGTHQHTDVCIETILKTQAGQPVADVPGLTNVLCHT